MSSIKYQPAEGWHSETPKECQDYSIDINTKENPVRGDRAIIENPTIKIQWLCHRFQRFMIFLYFVCYNNVTPSDKRAVVRS